MYKIIICIFGCINIEKYKNEIKKIKETYEKNCNETIKILYFLGEKKCDDYHQENFIYLDKIRKVFSDLKLNNPHYKYLKIHYIDIRLETIIDEPSNIMESINFYNFDYSIIQLERINMLYSVSMTAVRS